jgi:biotin carboxyl carrier protein
LRVEIDGMARSVEIPVSQSAAGWIATAADAVALDIDGRAVMARLAPAPTVESAVRHAAHDGAAAASITAPMPGTVLAVRAAEGDTVEAGQVLVLLEAMKMENTVTAPAAGVVARVLVAEGDQVQRGQTLVELV